MRSERRWIFEIGYELRGVVRLREIVDSGWAIGYRVNFRINHALVFYFRVHFWDILLSVGPFQGRGEILTAGGSLNLLENQH